MPLKIFSKKISSLLLLLIFFFIAYSFGQTNPFEFDCPLAPTMDITAPDSIDMAEINQLKKKISDGLHKPNLIQYREINFDHVGVSMPQWSLNGEWLAVQVKTSSSKIPYQLHLLYFPKHESSISQESYQRYIIEDQNKKSIFYSFRWAQRQEISQEFCLISGGFRLYWGKANNSSPSILVSSLAQESLITQPNWFHTKDKDYIAFLQGNQIFIGELTNAPSRQFNKVWEIQLGQTNPSIHAISYFQAKITPEGLAILVCGASSQGENLYLVKLKDDFKTVDSVKIIEQGIFKLPEWNNKGDRALVYRVRRVSNNDDAQELYLYLYAPDGSGDILSRSPTIQNREKEPEHDYVGPTWSEWNIDKEPVEGITHFFKQTDYPQHFAIIYFPIEKKQFGYQVAKLDMATFPVAFGRGRKIVFAGSKSYRIAWTFFDAARQKNVLFLGLLNFATR